MPNSVVRAWWKEAVVYQIYPISFADSNGDGLGDLNGIYSKLDYLKDLGVDVVWLCPIYPSPLADMGYDISDYCNIDPRYGTLEDWDRLARSLHNKGMKLMMDLVVNHTSDEHPWFVESRSSKLNNPKRDWYVWRAPTYDSAGNRKPPNNWKSVFQGSAWEYDEPTDEYYLHLYVSKQPDLNWENPDVREAVHKLMRFWLDRGCDGFRMDVINKISKVDGLPNAPVVSPDEEYQPAGMYYVNGPRVHEFVRELNSNVLSRETDYDTITVGETPYTHSSEEIAKYVLPVNKELNMVFQFQLMYLDATMKGDYINPLIPNPWKLSDLKSIITHWQQYKKDEEFWNALFLENHDHSRSVSRFGDDSDQWRTISANLLALLLTTQSGTLYIYQGEELGMKNFPRSWGIEEYKDVATQNYWKKVLESRKKTTPPGASVDMSDVLDGISRKARDHSRTPIQWDSTPNAGFTTGTPWMRVNDDYKTCNAENQLRDNSSVFHFWKRALQLRKEHDVLIYGDFEDISSEHDQLFAYTRKLGNTMAVVLLNFSNKTITHSLDQVNTDGFQYVLGNYNDGVEKFVKDVELRGYEGRVYIHNAT